MNIIFLNVRCGQRRFVVRTEYEPANDATGSPARVTLTHVTEGEEPSLLRMLAGAASMDGEWLWNEVLQPAVMRAVRINASRIDVLL